MIDEIHDLEMVVVDGQKREITLLDNSMPLFFMLKYNAIKVSIEQITVDLNISEESKLTLEHSSYNKAQYQEKTILTNILEKRGFKSINYEQWITNGRCDVCAFHPETKIIIVGECGPCRLDKIIETLKRENHELWHLTKASTLNIYQRDKKWDGFSDLLKKIERKILEGVRKKINESPLTNLNIKEKSFIIEKKYQPKIIQKELNKFIKK